MKKNTLRTIAAAGAFAMALTLLPAGSAQAASVSYLPTKSVSYDMDNGKWVKSAVGKISYNKKGLTKLSTSTSYLPDGSKSGPASKIVYTYSGSKLRTLKEYSGKDLLHSETNKYDKKGRLVKVKSILSMDMPAETTYKYKGKGKKPVSSVYYFQGRKSSSTKYSYRGRTETQKTTYTDGTKEPATYRYNKSGRLIKMTTSSPDYKSTTTYKYDKWGNVTKLTSKNSYGSYVTKYSYQYYKKKFVKQEIATTTEYDTDGKLTSTSAAKTVYSGFKKFK